MSSPLSVLARVRATRPQPRTDERCEMCGAPLAEQHQHVVGVTTRALLCTCRPCYLLFTDADARLAYRAVPDRYLALPELPELGLPVGTAFLFLNSALDRVVALYPGPAGATESELALPTWEGVVAAAPVLASLRPDVEALLLHDGAAFLVPIDVCYRLVGELRLLWRGFDGGDEARERMADFFAEVCARAGA